MIKSQKDLNHEGQDHRSPPATSPQASHEKDSPAASGAARCPPAQPATTTPLREHNDKVIAQPSPAQPQALSLTHAARACAQMPANSKMIPKKPGHDAVFIVLLTETTNKIATVIPDKNLPRPFKNGSGKMTKGLSKPRALPGGKRQGTEEREVGCTRDLRNSMVVEYHCQLLRTWPWARKLATVQPWCCHPSHYFGIVVWPSAGVALCGGASY